MIDWSVCVRDRARKKANFVSRLITYSPTGIRSISVTTSAAAQLKLQERWPWFSHSLKIKRSIANCAWCFSKGKLKAFTIFRRKRSGHLNV